VALVYDILVAVIALQIGYFIAVVCRIAYHRSRSRSSQRRRRVADEANGEDPPIHPRSSARTFRER
jgi:hypothetical protein